MAEQRGPLDPWDRPVDPRDPMTLTGDLRADANRWCLDNLTPRRLVRSVVTVTPHPRYL